MKLFGKIIITAFIVASSPLTAFAYSNTSLIGAKVQISVCGNNVVETGEDCEMGLKQQYECSLFGSYTGKVTCDQSCAFDVLSCNPISTPQNTVEEEPEVFLPQILQIWDENNDGKIEIKEFTTFIATWVNNWKSFMKTGQAEQDKESVVDQCDLNLDNSCNLVDFSIILYHVDND